MDNKDKLELARDWYNDQSTTKKEKVLVSGNWDKIYAYMKKKLEKKCEQNKIRKQESQFLNFISVKDRLPELRECVLVFGVLDANIPIFNSDGERIYHPDKVFDVWFNKRTEPSEHTDGNGFLLLKFHEEYKITHWFPLPKLDGKELYERI